MDKRIQVSYGVTVLCFAALIDMPTIFIGRIVAADTDLRTMKALFNIQANYKIPCSDDYKKLAMFRHCTPKAHCSRNINDSAVSYDDAIELLEVAKRGFSHGGSNGSVSILDLHCGALSKGSEFINIFKHLNLRTLHKTFNYEDFELYSNIIEKVRSTIIQTFDIDGKQLHLTYPTFFSRITNATANTSVEEYWRSHVDKAQYPSFDYTSLLYLADYGTDFTGGRFFFERPKQLIIEPKIGRLSFFTSGSENPHHVEKVETGIRYAVTISFTCNSEHAIDHPQLSTG